MLVSLTVYLAVTELQISIERFRLFFKKNMKKILIVIVCLFSFNWLNAKDSPAILVFDVVEPIEGSKDNTFEDNDILVKFWPSYGKFCMQINNKREDRIYIEWENARTNGEKVMFGDDTQLTAKQPKSDESVPGKSESVIRDFYKKNPLYNPRFPNNYPFALALHREVAGLARLGTTSVEILLPIRFVDNTTKDYKIRVKVKYQNTADFSGVTIGTSEKYIKNNIGKPDYKKDGEDGSEKWVYTNNAILTMKKGKVVDIKQLKE